jgi:hypothetical protein
MNFRHREAKQGARLDEGTHLGKVDRQPRSGSDPWGRGCGAATSAKRHDRREVLALQGREGFRWRRIWATLLGPRDVGLDSGLLDT